MPQHQTVLILDFGGQYTQLIARRVREHGVYCEIYPFDLAIEKIEDRQPIGIILSGGPESVFAAGAPRADKHLYELGIPTLAICYGMQLIAQHLGGTVEKAVRREYGRAEIEVSHSATLFAGLEPREQVWMSHSDRIVEAPPGFEITAHTPNAPMVAFEHPGKKIFGVQFHPEVSHTRSGAAMLKNFLRKCCKARGDWQIASFVDDAIASIRRQVAGDRVICALSGGVDSTVMAALIQRAIGDQLVAVFVDNGLLRQGEAPQVTRALRQGLGLRVVAVDARREFLGALAGVADPEVKRNIIGRTFISVFERTAASLEGIRFLAQGTLYPDVIESVSVNGPSATIKTHHNVGGLPEDLDFELVEPLRFLFKDEVRALGRELDLHQSLLGRHPFPGPGLAVRILGEVNAERVEMLQAADAIFISELEAADLYDQVSQAFTVLLPVKSVGVMGDERTYDHVVALRSVDTEDFMTADWSRLPYDLLAQMSTRIINEVSGVNRVVYDISSKPP
ncbi:MAG: glutamine-hydrolyzing GMP synthase, partial [Thermoanaerobaculia bacterium]